MPRRTRLAIAGLAVASVIGAGAVATTIVTASAHERFAKATLRTADGSRVGTVAFQGGRGSRHTEVTVRLRHAETLEAFHGFHIHANDTSTNGNGCIADPTEPASTWFVSADGHWKHDRSELHGHHAGDLPSVFVNADGTASIRFNLDTFKPAQIIGRAVVLHAGADNFGNVPVGPGTEQYTAGSGAVAKTQATGNAGDRFACGVIGKG
jgi:superoxide dismutase, Cu-Zn family